MAETQPGDTEPQDPEGISASLAAHSPSSLGHSWSCRCSHSPPLSRCCRRHWRCPSCPPSRPLTRTSRARPGTTSCCSCCLRRCRWCAHTCDGWRTPQGHAPAWGSWAWPTGPCRHYVWLQSQHWCRDMGAGMGREPRFESSWPTENSHPPPFARCWKVRSEKHYKLHFISRLNIGKLTEEVFWHCSRKGWSSKPLICSISAVLRNELILSWSTSTSPAYMKASRRPRSSSLTSLRMMIGCWQGLLCKKKMLRCFSRMQIYIFLIVFILDKMRGGQYLMVT